MIRRLCAGAGITHQCRGQVLFQDHPEAKTPVNHSSAQCRGMEPFSNRMPRTECQQPFSKTQTDCQPLNDEGYLPEGVHEATVEEIVLRFGQASELRQVQMEYIVWLVDLARRAGVQRLIINGSFVSDRLDPQRHA